MLSRGIKYTVDCRKWLFGMPVLENIKSIFRYRFSNTVHVDTEYIELETHYPVTWVHYVRQVI